MSLQRMKAFARKVGIEGGENIRDKQEMLNFINYEINKKFEEEDEEATEKVEKIHPLTKRWREYQLEQELAKTKDLNLRRKIRQDLAALRGLELSNMFDEKRSSLSGYARELNLINEEFMGTPQDFFKFVKVDVEKVIKENKNNRLKCVLYCLMEKENLRGENVKTLAAFHSEMESVLPGDNTKEIFRRIKGKILENFANFLRQGGNWTLLRIEEFSIFLARYQPLKGSGSFLKLPPVLKKKHAVVNIKNDDWQCFKWAVGRALHPVENHPERLTEELRRQCMDLNFEGISFPVSLNQINRFEKMNPEICVNVFGWDENQTVPLRISKVDGFFPVDLMLITKNQNEQNEDQQLEDVLDQQITGHYCPIVNMSRLLSSQVSTREKKKHFCRRCLTPFGDEALLQKHLIYCSRFEPLKPEMPPEGSVLTWKNFQRKQKIPCVIYADFEARLVPVERTNQNPHESFTEKFQSHIPVSFAFHLVSDVVKREPVLYRAKCDEENVGDKFVEELIAFVLGIQDEIKFPKKMILEDGDVEKFEQATICWICEKPFEVGVKKVKDHCHFSGKFRGAAHEKCNLLTRKPKIHSSFLL